MSQHDLRDITESTEGEHKPSLAEILDSTESGQASLHPDTAQHALVEALLIDRARVLAEMEEATHSATRAELQKELRRIGIRLARAGVPASIRRAK